MSFTWNDFVEFSLRLFGGLSNGAITAILIMLSILMALLLVFFTLELAKDRANSLDEEEEEEQVSSDQPQEAQIIAPQIEVLPVYSIQSYEIVEEDGAQSQTQIVDALQEYLNQETAQELPESVEQAQDEGATEALKKGIATVLPVEDETGEMGVRYDRSFTAKLIQSDDEVKEWYSDIKNHLLSYKRVRARTSWGRESFRIGKDCFARLVIKGKTLCILLAIIPESCNDTKYKIEDIADLPSCKDTPCLYRIKSNRRVTYAKELIDVILEEYDAQLAPNREAVDYYMPYEGTVDLIKRGLVKRRIVAKNKDFLTQITSSEGGDGMGVA